MIYGLPWGEEEGGRRRRRKGDWKAERRKKNKREGRKKDTLHPPSDPKNFFFAQCVFTVFFSPIAIVPKIQFAFFCLSCLPPPFLIKTNPFFPIQPTFPFFVSCRLGKWEEGGLFNHHHPRGGRRKNEIGAIDQIALLLGLSPPPPLSSRESFSETI